MRYPDAATVVSDHYYNERWYWCEVTEADEPPDFSLVPEDRRDMVRHRWELANEPTPRRWKMWGPQIPWYLRNGYDLRVMEAAE